MAHALTGNISGEATHPLGSTFPEATRQTFRYSPHTEPGAGKRCSTLTLSPQRFLARLLQHVPEPRRHTVRYYGLYAHACAAQPNQARALHAQPLVAPPAPIDWQRYVARFGLPLDPSRCPQCHAPPPSRRCGGPAPGPHHPAEGRGASGLREPVVCILEGARQDLVGAIPAVPTP